ncbi:YcaO-like family protein [Denitrobaculum tricleocarpae]|nr:YcaO-like family protein [Denitrobaculum tricleocarpae]
MGTENDVREFISAIEQTGLIDEIRPAIWMPDEPQISAFICRSSLCTDALGFGVSLSEDHAKLTALAECLERMALLAPLPTKRRMYDAHRNDIDLFDLFHQRDKQLAHFCSWWPVTRCRTGQRHQIPAQFLLLGHMQETRLLHIRNSSGTAFGKKGTGHALRTAKLELVERYFVEATFYEADDWRPIKDFPESLNKLIQNFQDCGLKPHIFDIPSNLDVSVIMVLLVDQQNRCVALTAGSAASFDLYPAIEKALIESAQSRSSRRAWLSSYDERAPNSIQLDTTLARAKYWADSKSPGLLRLDEKIGKPVAYQDAVQNTRLSSSEKEKLLDDRLDFFVADITPPALAKYGFEVLRVYEKSLVLNPNLRRAEETLPSPFV